MEISSDDNIKRLLIDEEGEYLFSLSNSDFRVISLLEIDMPFHCDIFEGDISSAQDFSYNKSEGVSIVNIENNKIGYWSIPHSALSFDSRYKTPGFSLGNQEEINSKFSDNSNSNINYRKEDSQFKSSTIIDQDYNINNDRYGAYNRISSDNSKEGKKFVASECNKGGFPQIPNNDSGDNRSQAFNTNNININLSIDRYEPDQSSNIINYDGKKPMDLNLNSFIQEVDSKAFLDTTKDLEIIESLSTDSKKMLGIIKQRSDKVKLVAKYWGDSNVDAALNTFRK